MKRRSAIAGIGVCVGRFSGCLALSPRMAGGGLVIRNNDSSEHTFSVTISKMSEDDDDLPHSTDRRTAPEATPIWQQDVTYDVAAGDSLRETQFITEPGAFFVEVEIETGATAGRWLGLYPAGKDGTKVAEAYVSVSVSEDGALDLSLPVLD